MATAPDSSLPRIHIRPETSGEVDAISAVTAAAFSGATHSAPPSTPGGPPGEVDLVLWLRQDEGWLPHLSLVAESDGRVVGHVVCTRGHVDDVPVLGLGPLSVHPDVQRQGVGTALVEDVLARAEGAGEALVALLGEPAYYARFGFVPSSRLGVTAPDDSYGAYFQVRPLGNGVHPRGRFRYAAPFDRL